MNKKTKNNEPVICIFDDNAPSITDKILEAFEQYLKKQLTEDIEIKKGNDQIMNIEYKKIGDYLLPNLVLENKNYEQIGKYGLLRLEYIKENKNGLYQSLLMKNELTSHLLSVSKECEERFKNLMDSYIKSDEKLSEKNKEINQLEWVKLMNNYRNCADEIILKELVYV